MPNWVGPRIEASLGGFVMFGKDIVNGDQFQRLAAELHGLRDHVLLSIDEEGGDVNRLENLGGFSMPGNRGLGELDELELTRQAAFQTACRWSRLGSTGTWPRRSTPQSTR